MQGCYPDDEGISSSDGVSGEDLSQRYTEGFHRERRERGLLLEGLLQKQISAALKIPEESIENFDE
jgi:hypothetical protein